MFQRLLLVSLLSFLLVPTAGKAQEGTKPWYRYPAISPNGSELAFSYRGDLWLVPTEGGEAKRLTTHEGYENSPVWAPDGETLAFAADWNGNFDIYTISRDGGVSNRVTFHSSGDTPNSFSDDGKSILFSSRRLDAPQAVIGSTAMGELYSIPVAGGRPVQVLTTEAEFASKQPGGSKILYQDYKGFENIWRKHHTSSVTRDIWIYDPADQSHVQVSKFEGEDRNPVWAPDGKSFYYLSEKAGNFNVWQGFSDGEKEHVQVTDHKTHPVRFLSIAKDGTLAYGFNGQLWKKAPDQDATQIEVAAVTDLRSNPVTSSVIRDGATEMSISPNEEEVAFIVRGELFVSSVEFGTTKRITNTPTQERSVSWSKDGRTLYYAAERDGSWNLYKSSITREEEDRFSYSTLITEEPVLVTDDETFQPLVSPDGKKLVYLKNRDELMLLDLETKNTSTLVPGKKNFSYSDGDINYSWSKDSRWLTFTYMGQKGWTEEIGVLNLTDGEIINISQSGYSESQPKFSSNGNLLMYISDRYGLRSHGSWGSDDDIMGLYLTQNAYDEAVLDEEELKLAKARKERAKKDEKKADEEKDESKKDGDKKEDEVEPIKFDLEDRDQRLRRMTILSALVSGFDLSPDGETLIYLAQVEDNFDVWVCKVRDQSTYKVLSTGSSSPGSIEFSKDGKSAFMLQGGRIQKLELGAALSPGGKASPKPVRFAAEMNLNGPAERAYLFEHAWRQAKRKFYDPNLHGVDWDAMKANYLPFVASINNNHDFAELLSELLGELNASHTGSGYRMRSPNGDSTAALGLLYDVSHTGVGLKVAEVLDRGPLDNADTKIKAGTVITHIDGVRLTPDVNPNELMNRKADTLVRLSLSNPETSEEWEEVVTPVSANAIRGLMYERWIETRREETEKLSNGRIGYVHVQGMNDPSFRQVYNDVLGRNHGKEALIVDTRFNGGGWLHDDLVTFLDGEEYIFFVPRGKEKGDLGGEPIGKWTKPVVVLQSESNYSDAHFFPWAFKELGVGKLIGAPVPGTATAVWWETLIDPTLYFGIPQVGMKTRDGEYLENKQLEPDVLVINDPQSMAAGQDKQLEKAVEVLISELDEK